MPMDEPGDFPVDGVELTQLLVVGNLDRSRKFYQEILGARLFREYGGTSVVLNFQGNWILLVTGGEPTEDKPGVTFAPPTDPNSISQQMTFRVPDCHRAYEILKDRGAEFLTPPFDRGGEIRCFFRDPDGRLLEISEVV